MILVAYAVVPWIVELIETAGGYNPEYYEPKDIQREVYLRSLPVPSGGTFGWPTVVKLILLVLAGLLWLSVLTTAPWRGSRR